MSASDFQSLQRAFGAHIRAPDAQPRPPEVPERRMQIYRELVHSTNAGLVGNAFPVLQRIVGEDSWQQLVDAFLAHHQSATPLFHEIAGELVDFLVAGEHVPEAMPPFAGELAHYEWVELALAIDSAEPDPAHADPNGDLLAGVPVLSPLAWPLAYRFPVHRLSPDYQPEPPPEQPTWLLAHRTRADDVRFSELNAVSARLLALIAAEPAPGRELLARIAAEAGREDDEALLAEGAAQMQRWRESDILLGTQHVGNGHAS